MMDQVPEIAKTKAAKVSERTRPARRPTVSREWVNAFAEGREVKCTRPWDTIKINLFNETKVCCSFFTKLPTFEWASAKDFHETTGMWNHPLMQHLRRTMRTPDELPYCTLCMDADKRDPKNSEALAEAVAKSIDIFKNIQKKREYTGRIDGIEGSLPDWIASQDRVGRGEAAWKPFQHNKEVYRTAVKKFGLVGRRAVVLWDVNPMDVRSDSLGDHPIAPFLAEANKKLFVNGAGRRVASELCRQLGLKIDEFDAGLAHPLPFDRGAIDGIWMRGKSLIGINPHEDWKEIRRVLGKGGTLHVRRAPCIGPLLNLAKNDNARGDTAWRFLLQGPVGDERINYFSRRSLASTLEYGQLVIDSRYPIVVHADNVAKDRSRVGRLSAKELASELAHDGFREEMRGDPSLAAGFEQFVSFNATIA